MEAEKVAKRAAWLLARAHFLSQRLCSEPDSSERQKLQEENDRVFREFEELKAEWERSGDGILAVSIGLPKKRNM